MSFFCGDSFVTWFLLISFRCWFGSLWKFENFSSKFEVYFLLFGYVYHEILIIYVRRVILLNKEQEKKYLPRFILLHAVGKKAMKQIVLLYV